MHIENELVEFMASGEQEYDEVIKEYEEEVLVQEEFPEPPMTDTANTTPAQGKPRCITFILIIPCIYIYIYTPMSLTRAGSSSALLRFTGSMSNLPLLTTGDYYY
jgi:hypothetical protein